MRPKVGLVLGSGGLRGLAHIGVLRVLCEENIPIDCVAGCSIGSLIGALYCTGMEPNTMYKLAKSLKRRHWLDFVVPKMGIVAGQRLYKTMKLLTKQKKFSDLAIPLAVVGTELNEGVEYVFTEGDIAMAVRASTAVPGVFNPCAIEDKLFVDGAVLNPTPIDVARKMGAEVVIAVDLVHATSLSNISNIFDVVIQTISIVECQFFKLRQHECDVLIRPSVEHISPSSFNAIDECVQHGEDAARQAIPQIKELIENKFRKCGQVSEENQQLLTADTV